MRVTKELIEGLYEQFIQATLNRQELDSYIKTDSADFENDENIINSFRVYVQSIIEHEDRRKISRCGGNAKYGGSISPLEATKIYLIQEICKE